MVLPERLCKQLNVSGPSPVGQGGEEKCRKALVL